MKNRTIRDRYAALTVLSQRVLPSTTAINKTSSLLLRFKVAYDATETKRKEIIADSPAPVDWEKGNLPPHIAEVREKAVELMLDETQPIKKVPENLRLTDADLPKVLKREGGEGNVEGLAQIKAMLGPLYRPTTAEETEFATATADGFEEDGQGEVPVPVVDERVPEHAE